MIFYFTGTGNSLFFAQGIADALGEKLLSIPSEMRSSHAGDEYTLTENETLGFVYPVYAWGPPKIVLDFISSLKVNGAKPYVFSVCTCGEQEGHTSKILRKSLAHRGLSLDCAFTARMPNNYIVGYDVDSEQVVKDKLRNAENQLVSILDTISKRKTGKTDLIQGTFPALKSAVVNPLFNQFAISTGKFYATDACTSCGLCERICPVGTIKIDGKPTWGKTCTQCLGCLNRCPVHAIQYGKGTENRGRYVHPILRRG